MKCPHCGYTHGWDNQELKSVEGKDGGFFHLPVKLEREEYWSVEMRKLYACPSCKKTFIE